AALQRVRPQHRPGGDHVVPPVPAHPRGAWPGVLGVLLGELVPGHRQPAGVRRHLAGVGARGRRADREGVPPPEGGADRRQGADAGQGSSEGEPDALPREQQQPDVEPGAAGVLLRPPVLRERDPGRHRLGDARRAPGPVAGDLRRLLPRPRGPGPDGRAGRGPLRPGLLMPPETIRIAIARTADNTDLPLPEPATAGSAGVDLRACVPQPVVLPPGRRALIPTGLRIALPPGFEGQVRPRSGLALREGLTMLNTPGTIDSDYRGEIAVVAVNLGQEPVTIRRGDRIAQLV